jgi:hypothetical protein
MKTSEQTNDLITALAKARVEFPTITRNCAATARGGREYRYADLSTIAEATAPVLATHGLVLMQGIEDGDNGQLCISSTLYHTSGQWMQCALSVPKPASMQEVGSLSTYIRRYQQSALLNIVTEDDDDVASTAGATTEPKKIAAPDTAHKTTGISHPLPVGEGGTTGAATNGNTPPEPGSGEPLERPTLAHMEALAQLVTVQCGADIEELHGRIRHTLGLRPDASTAPRLMVRVMTMAQYMTIFQHFTKVAEQLAKAKGKEAPGANTPAHVPASPATAAPAAEHPKAVPSPAASTPSLSAPGPDDIAQRERLVREAMDAGIAEGEAWYCVKHHSLQDAERLLLDAAKKRIKAA